MDEPVQIRLFGAFDIRVGGEAVPQGAWRLRKAKSLVKLLALAPERRVHRERATELLWPEQEPGAATNNFHQALYVARRALEAAGAQASTVLPLRDDMLVLNPGGPVEIDVDAFEAAVVVARETGELSDYRAALDLHGGELLPEDRFEACAAGRREALAEMHLQLVHARADENPELLWGLRGGGGNFGIVTSLEFQLHPIGPMLVAGPIFFAGDRAEEVLHFYRDWVRDLPEEMTTLVNLTTAPPAPFLPEAAHGKPIVAVIAVHAGEHEEGRALVQPLKDLGDPIADLIDVLPYTAMQGLLDALWGRGAHNYMCSAYVDELTDEAIAATVGRHRAVPAPSSEIHFHHFGGAVTRGGDESAFGGRSAEYALNVIARTPYASGFEDSVAWARDTTAALAPVSRDGAYTNFMGDAGDDRLRATYGDEKYERLRALKRRYDPSNVFQLNQNIAP